MKMCGSAGPQPIQLVDTQDWQDAQDLSKHTETKNWTLQSYSLHPSAIGDWSGKLTNATVLHCHFQDVCKSIAQQKQNAMDDAYKMAEQLAVQVDGVDNEKLEQILSAVKFQKMEHDRWFVGPNLPKFSTEMPYNKHCYTMLTDWLVDVMIKFALKAETFVLCIGLLWRLIAVKKDMTTHNFQKWALACMHTAAQYEEIYAPEITDWHHICDKAYSVCEIRDASIELLFLIGFDVSFTTHFTLARLLSNCYECSDKERHLHDYICQSICVGNSLMIEYEPIDLALAALWIGRCTLDDRKEHSLQNCAHLWKIAGRSHGSIKTVVERVLQCTPDKSKFKALLRLRQRRWYAYEDWKGTYSIS